MHGINAGFGAPPSHQKLLVVTDPTTLLHAVEIVSAVTYEMISCYKSHVLTVFIIIFDHNSVRVTARMNVCDGTPLAAFGPLDIRALRHLTVPMFTIPLDNPAVDACAAGVRLIS